MIRDFHTEDAAHLARMWNASDESWPGGFTHGVPFTSEYILENLKKERTLAHLVVWESGEIVGSVEVTEFWEHANTAYVSVINVVPTHQGKGYGRELLKKCVDIVTQHQYDRLDLFTWPGNLRAVPLYKKVGFFWVPKTGVHMKNYIPFIRNLDAASPFFAKHDWYTSLKRDLKVEEDDYNGIFPYLWEEDGDMLSVSIDAESGGIAAFETNEFSVSQSVGKAFIGKRVKVQWTLRNKMDHPVQVDLIARGGKGISLYRRESLLLSGECTLEGEAFIEDDLQPREEKEPPYLLTTDVVINGVSLPLVSGLRVCHPIAVSTDPEYLFLPRGERTISVIVHNTGDELVEGCILLENTGESHPFSLPPHYKEAVPFTVSAERDCDLHFGVEGITHLIPVCVTEGAGVMQKGKKVVLENSHATIVVPLLGGEMRILEKRTRKPFTENVSDEVGPPFSPSRIPLTWYRAKTYRTPGKAVAELTVEVKEWKITLVRRIEMDSTPLIRLSYRIIPSKDLSLHVRGSTFISGGILTVPLREGIVSARTMEQVYPMRSGDVPSDPSEYREPWICYEREGSAFGVIWDECTEIRVHARSILDVTMTPEEEKEKGEERHLYLYCGRGTWREVREAWSRLHGVPVKDEEPLPLWRITPPVVFCTDASPTCTFTLESHRGHPMEGSLDGKAFEVKRGVPFTFTKTCGPLHVGVNNPTVKMETDVFTREIPLPVVRVGEGGDVSVREGEVVTLDNGLYQLRVAPHFCGALVFFGKEENHLLTSYPEVTQFSFFKPWWGGVHPVIFLDEFPGRMWREHFSYRVEEREVDHTWWRGVTVMCESEEVKGARLETAYLTTGRSNVTVIESRVTNLTAAPLTVTYGVLLYTSPDGVRDTTLYFCDDELHERRRTPYGGTTRYHDWAAVKGRNTYLTIVGRAMDIFDMGPHGAHVHAIQEETLPPRGAVSSVVYVAAADSLEASLDYRVLKKVQWM